MCVYNSSSSKHFCSSYFVPDPLHRKIKLTLIISLKERHYYYPHFTNEEIEAERLSQRDNSISQGLHSQASLPSPTPKYAL